MSAQTTTREALLLAVQVQSGETEIEWRNIAGLGDVLYALTRGARTDAKREAYNIIRDHVNAAFRADCGDDADDIVRPYPEA